MEIDFSTKFSFCDFLNSLPDSFLIVNTQCSIVEFRLTKDIFSQFSLSLTKNNLLETLFEETIRSEIKTGIINTINNSTKFYTTFFAENLQRYLEIRITKINNQFALVLLRDVTLESLKQIENLNLLTAIEQSSNSIVITDTKGRILFVNKAFEKNTGYSRNEAVGQNPRILKTDYLKDDIYSEMWKTISSGKTWQGEFHNRRKDGTLYWENAMITPITDKDGNVINYIAVKEDITEKKNIKALLQEQNENLQKINDELITLNATKDKFFSIIAHDLKNPFNTLIGFSDILIKSGKKLSEEKKQDFLKLIYTSSVKTYELLENLLLWGRSQTKAIPYKPDYYDLPAVITENVEFLRLQARNKQICIRTNFEEQNILLKFDKNMISAVLRNLITNAIKFTGEKGKIEVSTKKIEKNDRTGSEKKQMIQVNVTDNGIGIPEHICKALFKIQEFRTTRGTSNESGSGLGLIISKEFINQHNGEIFVESTLDKGSTFSFTLPLF